jgi:hypothetical protein
MFMACAYRLSLSSALVCRPITVKYFDLARRRQGKYLCLVRIAKAF